MCCWCFKEIESLVSPWNNSLLIAKPAFNSLKLSGRCRENIFFSHSRNLVKELFNLQSGNYVGTENTQKLPEYRKKKSANSKNRRATLSKNNQYKIRYDITSTWKQRKGGLLHLKKEYHKWNRSKGCLFYCVAQEVHPPVFPVYHTDVDPFQWLEKNRQAPNKTSFLSNLSTYLVQESLYFILW